MKVSLAWIFEHIVACHTKPWHSMGSVDSIKLTDLITRFNESVAEIEGFYTWHCYPDNLILARVDTITNTHIHASLPKAKNPTQLPLRDDLAVGDHALVYSTGNEPCRWARMSDFGSSKESLLPAFDPQSVDWHTATLSDTILEIDNKSITHRPDLWSHRGLAREIAALYGLKLKNVDTLLANVPVSNAVPGKKIAHAGAPTLMIDAPNACRRLAAGSVTAAWQPSMLSVALRLCRVDSRPIDALVDLTNYVMLDYGQPMHAFDSNKIQGNTLVARTAKTGEKLTVLDGTTLELHPTDLVIADTKTALSLAGVMGGAQSGVSRSTTALCLEAGSFEPSIIRHTVGRYTKRTESSMRFEKNLDPEMPIHALQRYVALLQQYKIPHNTDLHFVECGTAVKPVTLSVTHALIEKRLGVRLTPEKITAILEALACEVKATVIDGGPGYVITVPTFRATKDLMIPEDIVEEIGRFVGYKNIPTQLPALQRGPSVAQTTYRTRTLKQYCSTALRMHEISSYAFYDESWLNFLRWQPAATLEALNPVSGNWRRLVTSLIPGLLKAVHENAEGATDARYFEVGRTWLYTSPIVEQKQLAGIVYTRAANTDFYTLKEYVHELCKQVGITVTWHTPNQPVAPWYDPYRVAQCIYNDTIIGTIGLVAEGFKERIVQTGFMGIFELDLATLSETKIPTVRYQQLAKYPEVVRDVSVKIATDQHAAAIMAAMKKVDSRICAIEVVDFFKKPEWVNQISISFRYTIRDNTKTLTTAEADTISTALEHTLKKLGGEIR